MPDGNRRYGESIPPWGSWRDPRCSTQTPGQCWGPGPQSLPVEAKAEMEAAPGQDSLPGEESRQRPSPGGGRHPGTRWVGSQPLIKGPEPLAGDAGDRPPRPQCPIQGKWAAPLPHPDTHIHTHTETGGRSYLCSRGPTTRHPQAHRTPPTQYRLTTPNTRDTTAHLPDLRAHTLIHTHTPHRRTHTPGPTCTDTYTLRTDQKTQPVLQTLRPTRCLYPQAFTYSLHPDTYRETRRQMCANTHSSGHLPRRH